jgi:putative spermidine/putrescine transport system permease protein
MASAFGSGAVRRLGALPAYAWLMLFLLLPLGSLLLEVAIESDALSVSLRDDALLGAAAWNTILLGAGTATLSLLAGAPLARAVARLSEGRRQLMLVLLGVPLTFSGLVIAYGFILAFGRAGFITQLIAMLGADPAVVGKWIYSTGGLAFAYGYYLIPRVALIMVPLFANLDRRPYDAALTLGAPPWRAWLDTDFRELAPSFAAIWCLIAAVAMGTYGTALALAGTQINILPLLIYLKISDGSGDFPMAAALSLLLLGMCVLVLAVGEWATRGRDRLLVTH